ncbi:hypothetical protein MAPG_04590 [Magnaporthiopsis poae ATCC 64411]|uniref:SMODS and SLOG-associating 2TM effector domain-containing protein n=1 Tax=Magnaporthiopsis poae (strain ATCC 64411 / 73-15) TaxID=644358 RepID=A0A0C4DX52_MAGP6|nr:hypothetical protein MAPG_04590 [Magnaporthiopsis poae ATCC 64411]
MSTDMSAASTAERKYATEVTMTDKDGGDWPSSPSAAAAADNTNKAPPSPPSPPPDPPTVDALHTTSPHLLNQPITLEAFRTLVGIPQQQQQQAGGGGGGGNNSVPPQFPAPSTITRRTWRHLLLRNDPSTAERPTSIYYKLRRDERHAHAMHALVDVIVYASMLLQMVFAAALIVLGALNGDYHLPVAVIGALTGILAGVLSLVKGQGLPNRYIRYAGECRRVADEIEFMERGLRAGVAVGHVTYAHVLELHRLYESAVEDGVANHPNAWVSAVTARGKATSGPGHREDDLDAPGGGRGVMVSSPSHVKFAARGVRGR